MICDELMGLFNCWEFDCILGEEEECVWCFGCLLGLVMLDLDCFKSVNDIYGYLVGDVVIWEVVVCFKVSIWIVDCVVWYGGEEFVVMLVEVDVWVMYEVVKWIVGVMVVKLVVLLDGWELVVILSVGLVCFLKDVDGVKWLVLVVD